jgi:hypothetical protein
MEEGLCTERAGIIMVGLALHGVLSSFARIDWRMYRTNRHDENLARQAGAAALHVNSSMGTLYNTYIVYKY